MTDTTLALDANRCRFLTSPVARHEALVWKLVAVSVAAVYIASVTVTVSLAGGWATPTPVAEWGKYLVLVAIPTAVLALAATTVRLWTCYRSEAVPFSEMESLHHRGKHWPAIRVYAQAVSQTRTLTSDDERYLMARLGRHYLELALK